MHVPAVLLDALEDNLLLRYRLVFRRIRQTCIRSPAEQRLVDAPTIGNVLRSVPDQRVDRTNSVMAERRIVRVDRHLPVPHFAPPAGNDHIVEPVDERLVDRA